MSSTYALHNYILHPGARRLIHSARALAVPLLERQAGLLVLCTVLITTLAYQVPLSFHLQVGGPLDEPFVTGFFQPETTPDTSFRWTRGRGEFDLPGVGAGVPLQLVLRAHGWRPEGQPLPRFEMWANGAPLGQLELSRVWHDYVVQIPASRDANDLALDFRTQTFKPSNDPRALGVAISDMTVERVGVFGATLPAPEQEARFFLIALGVYFIARRMKFRASTAFASGFGLAAAGALLIAFARPFLTVFTPSLLWIVALDCVLVLVLPGVVRMLFARGGAVTTSGELRCVWALSFAVLSFRLVGEFYPHPLVGDALFHLHLLQRVMSGQVLFSSSSGAVGFNQPIPYPPALYLLLTPLTTLRGDPQTLLAVFIALLDTIAALVVYYVVRQAGGSARAAWFATALDLILPISALNFFWAIYANLMSQACMLFALALWVAPARARTRAAVVLLAFALTLALLSHVSALPILIALIAVACFLLWFSRIVDLAHWVMRPALALGLALVVSLGLYYTQFGGLLTTGASRVLQTRLAQAGAAVGPLAIVGGGVKYPSLGLYRVPVYSVAQWVREGAVGLARETWVYYAVWPLLLAPLGLVLLWRQRGGRMLAALGWSGLLVGLAFALVGVVFGVYVRYPLLLLPFVAIGAGLALDALASRGRVGLAAAAGLLALTLLDTLWLWLRLV